MTSKIAVHPDSYYQDISARAIADTLAECNENERDLEETKFLLHKARPFDIQQSNGKAYKIWLQALHDAEAKLGVPPRVHRKPQVRSICEPVKTKNPTREDVLRMTPPKSQKECAAFLRKYCKCNIFMGEDFDTLRVVLKGTDSKENCIKWEYTAELGLDDPALYDAAYIEAAQDAFKVWRDLWVKKL